MHRMSPSRTLLTCLQPLVAALLVTGFPVQAQSQIYRCGSEYTNNPTQEQKQNCKALDGGNVTVIAAPKPKNNPTHKTPSAATPAADQPRVDPHVQKARDNDARAILEAEQRRAEQRLAELQREYNGGQPERRGEEVRNQQRYSERVASLKDSLLRAEADLAGIRRELGRLGSQSSAGNLATVPR